MDVVEAAEEVDRYTAGMTDETVVHDEKTVDAGTTNRSVVWAVSDSVVPTPP